ncbi:MAG TPA: hypothetical protein VFR37_13555 [Longimicrobium sp.]|nr:hypothetical protein [Longimicrobium sp.]
MTRSPVFEAVPPKKRDLRPLADRMRERVRQMDEAVSRREETYASKENGAIVFRTRRVA